MQQTVRQDAVAGHRMALKRSVGHLPCDFTQISLVTDVDNNQVCPGKTVARWGRTKPERRLKQGRMKPMSDHAIMQTRRWHISDLQKPQAHMLLHGEGGVYKPSPQENQQFPWGSLTEVEMALHPRDWAVSLHGAVRTRNAISLCLVLMADMWCM